MPDRPETTDPDDEEIEAIQEAAREAAMRAMHPAVMQNPYAGDRERAEIWSYAFRNAYAQEHGW